jgi:hypothetical protein
VPSTIRTDAVFEARQKLRRLAIMPVLRHRPLVLAAIQQPCRMADGHDKVDCVDCKGTGKNNPLEI